MSSHSVNENLAFSDRTLKKVKSILSKQNLPSKQTKIKVASTYQDTKESTDLIIETKEHLAVAVRVRRSNYKFNDPFTDVAIRSRTRFGNKTEIHKLKEGFADYYFYGWDECNSWVIFDIDQMRHILDRNLFEKVIATGEGFVLVPIEYLAQEKVFMLASPDVLKYCKKI